MPAIAIAATVSGCDDRPPTGQVLASVGGAEITRRDLADELGNAGGGSDAALDRLVDRAILSRIAVNRRLDRSPEYLAAVRRARQAILTSLLLQDLAADIAEPTDVQTTAFIAAHPWIFAGRVRFQADQVSAPLRSGDRDRLAGVSSIDEAARRLASDGRAVARATSELDSGALPREDAVRLLQGTDGAPTMLSDRRVTRVVAVRGRTAAPIDGERAIAVARGIIRRQALDAALARIEAEERRTMIVRYQAGLGPSR